jgi:hypothetical protein
LSLPSGLAFLLSLKPFPNGGLVVQWAIA